MTCKYCRGNAPIEDIEGFEEDFNKGNMCDGCMDVINDELYRTADKGKEDAR